MRLIFKYLNMFYKLIPKIINKITKFFIKKYFIHDCGKNVVLGRSITCNYENLIIGNRSSIGEDAYILNSNAKVIIGDNVMIAPKVTFITGNHRTDIVGKYMNEITENEKLIENDQNIIIENDVWIGSNVTILKGVTIGEGSIIGAGSIVVRDIESYSIVVPEKAKMVKKRFSETDIKKHEMLMKGYKNI